ncbi:hypothetical protein ACTXT7_006524 [Hymenolepis weldensis]
MREKTRLKLLDRRERKKLANEATTTQLLQPSKPNFSIVPDSLPVSNEFYHSDNASGSFDLDSRSGSFQHLVLKPFSKSMEDRQSTALDRESALFRKRRIGRKSQSFSSLYRPAEIVPRWIMELKIYTVYDINTAIVRDGTNTCIKIKQDLWTLGKTTMKASSSQIVWEETFQIPLVEVSQPIVLKYCSRKTGRFSTLGEAELSLDDCIVGVTYSKHLEILSPGHSRPIGMLRMQVCLHKSNNSFPVTNRSSTLEDSRRCYKVDCRFVPSRLHIKQKSSSVLNLSNTSATNVGPLKGGIQIFEARYLGLLQLNVVTRTLSIYSRRWNPLENQPGEVAVITNPLTKATEIVSPRLPWPPHFLRGVSALEFGPITGPQVAQFDSAVLYINVLSACGLQSIPLAKFLGKCCTDENSYNSMHRGVMAARLISYYQTMAKNATPLSTQVQLQMGKDKYLTTIKKSTFDPVWNQTFTFNLNNYSKTLIEVQLMSIQNPNITGPAAGIEKIGEALIDISRLPLDFTQRIEIELNGKRPKPHLLVLATLTGLTKLERPCSYLPLPSINVISSGDSNDRQSDTESNSFLSLQQRTSRGSLLSFTETPSSTQPSGEWAALMNKTATPEQLSLEEIDAQIIEHYGWKMALKNRFDVGYLRVNVIAASGLTSREMSTKCDSYCLLELINMRAQTQTVRKTLNPKWDKVFVFPVTDVHSVLYITVLDNEKYKDEFLGRVAIPLMKIRNHERSWYALKNADLRERSRGSILLEFFFVYNHFKAAWRTLNPIEPCLKHPIRPQKYKKLSVDYKNAVDGFIVINRLRITFTSFDPDSASNYAKQLNGPMLGKTGSRLGMAGSKTENHEPERQRKENFTVQIWLICDLQADIPTKKEEKPSPQFLLRQDAMQENVMRLKVIFKPLRVVTQYVEEVCSWENPWLTIGVLIGYNTAVWNFQPYMIPLGMIIGILVLRQTSKNPQLLDMLSSAKCVAGVGASNLGSPVSRSRLLGNRNSQMIDDQRKDTSLKSSFDCENDVLINTELLYSLENEFPSDVESTELERQNSEHKDPNKGKKKLNAIMEIVGDLPQIMDLIASAIEKTIGLFEWQVPWLTWFCLLFLGSALYYWYVTLKFFLNFNIALTSQHFEKCNFMGRHTYVLME